MCIWIRKCFQVADLSYDLAVWRKKKNGIIMLRLPINHLTISFTSKHAEKDVIEDFFVYHTNVLLLKRPIFYLKI